ncbi:MAG: NAD(P)-binding domain-containing protein [Rhodococcus sp. (in: high G+C Gram-positive bacteria)]
MSTDTVHAADVAVLGCGLMGSALASALAAAGYRVIVWNRTAAKADALRGERIDVARTAAEAASAAPLLLASVGTYDDVRDMLGGIDTLGGRTLVNFTTGTPAQATRTLDWAVSRQLAYLDAAILAYPQHIGTVDGLILTSGPSPAWDTHSQVLGVLGDVRHISEHVDAANVLDASMVGAFHISAVTALIESVTFAIDRGVSATEVLAVTEHVLTLFGPVAAEIVHNIATNTHDTDQATLEVYGAAIRSFVDTVSSDGHSARMVSNALAILEEGERAGLGSSGISALQRVCTPRPAASI